MRAFLILLVVFVLLPVSGSSAELLFSLQGMAKQNMTILPYQKEISAIEEFDFTATKTCIRVKTGKKSHSVTFVADINITALPTENGAIITRIGYHNSLVLRKEGIFAWGLFDKDKKFHELRSKSRVEIGENYRVAGVIERVGEKEYNLFLYVNGKEAAYEVMNNEPFPYGDMLVIGAAGWTGEHTTPFQGGSIKGVWIFDGALEIDEISLLK